MSKRIINTIVGSCLLLASSAFSSNKMPISEVVASVKYQSLASEYESYPLARRSVLTRHVVSMLSRLD